MRVHLEAGHGQGAGDRRRDARRDAAADRLQGRAAARSSRRDPAVRLPRDARAPGGSAAAGSSRTSAAAGRSPPSPRRRRAPAAQAAAAGFAGVRLTDVAQQVGLDFRQGAFRFGVTADTPAMMGGGLCWLDYDNDGWLDLFVVNSYADGDIGALERARRAAAQRALPQRPRAGS